MNILRYGQAWDVNSKFKVVCHEDMNIEIVETIESVCEFLAVNLNVDCKWYGDLIDEYISNYLVVDEDKNIFTIEYRHILEKNDVRIGLVSTTGNLAVTFDMSEYIDADERYY